MKTWDTSDFNAFALRRLYAAHAFIDQALQNIDTRVDITGDENFAAMYDAANLLADLLDNLIRERHVEGAEKVFIGGRVSYTLPDHGDEFGSLLLPRWKRLNQEIRDEEDT